MVLNGTPHRQLSTRWQRLTYCSRTVWRGWCQGPGEPFKMPEPPNVEFDPKNPQAFMAVRAPAPATCCLTPLLSIACLCYLLRLPTLPDR